MLRPLTGAYPVLGVCGCAGPAVDIKAAATRPPFSTCLAYAAVSEKTVSRKPVGSTTSNARLFHSVS